MKNKYYYKLDANNKIISGSLMMFTKKPKEGTWVEEDEVLCCSQLSRTGATVSGTIATADQAIVTLSCTGVTNPATITVALTAGNTAAVKTAAVLAAIQAAFGSFTKITSEAGVIYSRGTKCPTGVVFTIAYSVVAP